MHFKSSIISSVVSLCLSDSPPLLHSIMVERAKNTLAPGAWQQNRVISFKSVKRKKGGFITVIYCLECSLNVKAKRSFVPLKSCQNSYSLPYKCFIFQHGFVVVVPGTRCSGVPSTIRKRSCFKRKQIFSSFPKPSRNWLVWYFLFNQTLF